eukprot:jgi/Hompol1/6184/HPOL_002223-RA
MIQSNTPELIDEIRGFREAYLRSGGSDPAILAEISQLENEAIQIVPTHIEEQPTLEPPLRNRYSDISNKTATTRSRQAKKLVATSGNHGSPEISAATEDDGNNEDDVQKLQREHTLQMLKLKQHREVLLMEHELQQLKE